MPRVSKLIDNELYERACNELKKYGNAAKVSVKLKAIIAAKTHGISEVAEVFNVTRKSLMKWINDFKEQGSPQLLIQSGRGRTPKISDAQLSTIKIWVNNNPNITIKELRLLVEQHFQLSVSMMTVYRILRKLSFSYITPRPRHNKQARSNKA